jgi:hypothetical protein
VYVRAKVMAGRFRRRMHLGGPYGHPGGPWHNPGPPYGPGFGWGWGWGWGRAPTPEEEKEYIEEYIAMLKDELAAAEEYLQEFDKPE